MNRLYNREDLESFVNGMIRANSVIEQKKPDILIAPMMGAVPLIDALNAVNMHFDNSRVYYVPGSSSIQSLNNILPETVSNLLSAEVHNIPTGGLSIMSIDEVVSGSSVARIRKGVEEGIKRYAIREQLTPEEQRKISYQQIGIEHGAFIEAGKTRNEGYNECVTNGLVIPIEVRDIIPMDNPLLCPVKYVPKKNNRSRNTPVIIDNFVVTKEYTQLLSEIASFAGTDINVVGPRNFNRLIEHQAYIPTRYRKLL